jgi:hypothetical protein
MSGDAGHHFLRGIVAVNAGYGWVHAQNAAARRALKDADNGTVKDTSILLFRLAKLILHFFTQADVMAYAGDACDMAFAVKERDFCRQDVDLVPCTVDAFLFAVV